MRKAIDDITKGKSDFWYYPNGKLPNSNRTRLTSLGTKDEAEARRLWENIKARRAKHGGDMTWGDAWTFYCDLYYKAKATRAGFGTTKRRWDEIKHIFADLPIAASQDKVNEFRDNLRDGIERRRFPRATARCKLGLNTINAYLAFLAGLQNFVVNKSVNGKNLFPKSLEIAIKKLAKVERPHEKPRASVTAYLTEQQVASAFAILKEKRLASAEPNRLSINERIAIMLYFGGGQRSGRVGMLPWGNIDLKNRVIDFQNIRGVDNPVNKRAQEAMPISDELLPLLQRAWEERTTGYYLDGTLTTSALSERVKIINKSVGAPGRGHVWRKTVATHGFDAGLGDLMAETMGITPQVFKTFYVQKNAARSVSVVNALPVKMADAEAGKVVKIGKRTG